MPQEQDVSSLNDLPNTATLDGSSPPRYPVLHFDMPTIDGREIVSVDSNGIARSCVDEGPVIFVHEVDGKYYIARDRRRLPGEPFESIYQLIQSAGLQLLATFADLPPYAPLDAFVISFLSFVLSIYGARTEIGVCVSVRFQSLVNCIPPADFWLRIIFLL